MKMIVMPTNTVLVCIWQTAIVSIADICYYNKVIFLREDCPGKESIIWRALRRKKTLRLQSLMSLTSKYDFVASRKSIVSLRRPELWWQFLLLSQQLQLSL